MLQCHARLKRAAESSLFRTDALISDIDPGEVSQSVLTTLRSQGQSAPGFSAELDLTRCSGHCHQQATGSCGILSGFSVQSEINLDHGERLNAAACIDLMVLIA